MAAGRKATGTRDGIVSAPLAVPDNRPYTGPGARTRKGAHAGQVSLRGNDTASTGTGGQVGRHDRRDR
jgi:hypothetical protein